MPVTKSNRGIAWSRTRALCLQECERINTLTGEMKRSLRELDLGLKGELTITSDMEELESALFLDQVPATWSSRAYPSLLGLSAWFADLLLRLRELETWATDFVVSRGQSVRNVTEIWKDFSARENPGLRVYHQLIRQISSGKC